MPQPAHRTLVEALNAGRGLHERGFTFIRADRSELFLSWHQLRAEAVRRAHHLRSLGLQKGDRVALILPDGEDFIPTFFGAVWAGVVPVPLFPPMAIGKLDAYLDGVANILTKAEPRLLVTTGRVEKTLAPVMGRVPGLGGVVTVDRLAGEAPEASEVPESVEPSDIAFLQFTSGSTSAPKGVVVTHGNLQANAWSIMREGLNTDVTTDVGVSWLPLYHDMGLIGFVLSPAFHKIQVVFIPTLSFVKSSTLWLETLHKKRGTLTFAPNFAYALVTRRVRPEMVARWDLSSMRAFGCGAEPIHADTLRKFAETFSASKLRPEALLPCYGMAEATLAISFTSLSEPLKTDRIDARLYEADKVAVRAAASEQALEVVCCGRPFEHHEVGIFAEDGHRLPERTIGEIAFRGPSVAQGYFRNPEASARTFRDGWLFTGDLGYLADGEVYITGRKKDLIIVKGRNYDPQRIEWLVEELPSVRQGSAVAFSRPGADSEELVVVAETREQDQVGLRLAIEQKINEQLQLAAADVVLVGPGALPKTTSGKLQRQRTRSQYLAGTLGAGGASGQT